MNIENKKMVNNKINEHKGWYQTLVWNKQWIFVWKDSMEKDKKNTWMNLALLFSIVVVTPTSMSQIAEQGLISAQGLVQIKMLIHTI